MMQQLKEARDPTAEELEEIAQAEAKENYVNKMVALPMPKQGSKIPLEGGGYTQIDPLLANKPFEAPVQSDARDITMDDILEDYGTFKYFKQSGELKSKKGAGEMIMDGAKMIVEDMGQAAKTWPERFLTNFGITMVPLGDYISIPVIGTPSGMTSEQKKKFEEAKKRKRAKAVATQNQMLGDIELNYDMLLAGGSRVIDMLTSDDDSEEDLRSSYEFWKKLNEVEKHRQTIYLENTASWMTAGLDPEIKEMILSGEVQPDRKAAMGASMIADPANFIPFGAGLKGGSAFFNKIMRGPQIAMVNETKDAILKQAVIKKALELGEYAGKGAFGKGAEAAAAQVKALDGIILENLDKIQTMARPQREAMLRAAKVLPAGNPLKQLIQSEIKGIPVKGRRTFGGVVAGSGMVVTGKTIEGVGNAISFLKDLAPETAITIAMKMGIPEEKAVQLFQNGMASKLLKYGAAGSGTYALTDFLTDDEMLSTMATATVLGLPFLARYGRDAALLGRELMEPATELNYFQRLGANGREMITDRIIDRDTLFGTIRSTAEKSFKAGEGKLLNRILSPRGQLSTGTQGVVDRLNATKIGRTVESAGRLANQTAKGAAIGGSFGYIAGGGEQEEAMYGGIGGGSVFGGGAYTASKPFRMVGGKSAAEISQRRHGSYQYFVKNLLPSGMKESFSSMSKANQIAYANAAMSYKDTVFNFKSLGADGKGGRQYRVDGTAYIEVNTDSAWAIEPLLRHEITHYLEETGGSRQFTDLLLGNHLLEKKGIFTLVDDAGKPVMREDGKGYKTNKKLDDFKYEYGKFFFEPDKPRQEVIDLIPDDVIAREIVAEHGADFFLSDSRRYRDLHEGPTGALMRALVESPMLKNKTLLRSMIARLGGTFRADGTLQSPNGVFGQMQRIPAVTELIRKYNREIEGLSKEQVQKKFPIDEGQNVIDISSAEFAKNPELVEQLRAGTIMRVDENGNIVPDTAMTPAQQRKYNQDFSQALLDAVKRKDEADGLPAGHIREKENEKTKAISFEGRFIDESIIDEVASQGGWNKAQIDLFKEINLCLKNGTNAKGGSDWLISYFKATGKGGGRYVNAKVQHVLEVPYGIEITQKGNINIRTVNVDSLYKNIDKVFRQQQAEVTRLFGTSNPKDAFMDAMHQYHLNHGEGRHGWFNLDADPAIAKQKMNFINAMFGKSSKAHVDANPWLAALDSGAKSKQPRPVYRSRRIERIGKADQLTGQRHVDPVKIINNLMPPKMRPSDQFPRDYGWADSPKLQKYLEGSYFKLPQEEKGKIYPEVFFHDGRIGLQKEGELGSWTFREYNDKNEMTPIFMSTGVDFTNFYGEPARRNFRKEIMVGAEDSKLNPIEGYDSFKPLQLITNAKDPFDFRNKDTITDFVKRISEVKNTDKLKNFIKNQDNEKFWKNPHTDFNYITLQEFFDKSPKARIAELFHKLRIPASMHKSKSNVKEGSNVIYEYLNEGAKKSPEIEKLENEIKSSISKTEYKEPEYKSNWTAIETIAPLIKLSGFDSFTTMEAGVLNLAVFESKNVKLLDPVKQGGQFRVDWMGQDNTFRSRKEMMLREGEVSGEYGLNNPDIRYMPPKAEDMVQARTQAGMETIPARDAIQRGDVDQINMSMAGRPQFFGKDKDGKFAFLDDALAKEGVEKLSNALKEKDMQKRITKGWEAITNTSKAFKVPTTKSKNIERIVKQASGGKIVHRPFKNTDGEGFYLIRAEDDGLKNDQLVDYIFAYEDKLLTEIDGYGTLKVDSSSAPEQGKGFGFTAYQILLDYAAANDLVYAPSALSYINQMRSLSAMLSSALKHKSTKHLKPNVDNGFLRSEVKEFGKDYEQDVALLAMAELFMVRDRFKEIDNFDYNFKTGKFSEFNKPITNKRLQEQLMADDRIDGTYPAEDGVGLTTAKRAIITNKLFLSQVKDQGQVSSKIFDTGNIDGIAYMPPKPPFQTISTDVIKSLEGDKNAIQAKLTMADYPENPYQDSVALPSRMGVVNNKVSGMFKSYDDVTNLINKLVDKIEYYQKKYPEFAKRTASFYSDMGKTAFDMAKFVPMKGRSQYDIADLQLRFLALGSPRSAVAANMTKSGRSIMGHYTGISGHKINPVDQQVAAQETALDWKAGKHFEVLDPDRKGASDKVRNFYLNGLAELIDLAKADTSEGAAKAASEVMHREAVTLDLIKPKEKLKPQLEAKLNTLLDGLATVDMWDMAAKEYAHPAYVIKSGRDTPNAKPFLWSIPKHRVISTMAESGKNWKAAKKDMKIDSAAEMNFQQANALQVDNINNWNETTWAERSKKGFGEETKWSYYKKNDEGGLTPQGGGQLYDAHQTVDGLIADMLNKRGHASFFGKQKLVARNAQEILWALTKFENPLESNQQLVLFGDRFQHFKQAMQPLLAGKGLDQKKISKEAQGILGAILDTYNKTADQKFPFEVDTWGDSANAKAVQDQIRSFGDEFVGPLPEGTDSRSLGVQKITDAVADQLGAEVQKIADQYGEELVVQNVQRGFGGYTEDGAAAVTPNISMTMRGNPETVRSVMMEISSALDQADGNVFRQPTIIELNDPKTKFNQTISFETKGLTKQQQSDFFMDLNKLKDQDGEAFITGFTNTDSGMFIGDQYYKPNRLHDEIMANIQAIDKVMKKHKVKGFETHQLVAETFARGEKTGPRSSFQRGVHNLIKSKVRNAQGRKYNGLPEVPSQLQRVIDGMHNLSKEELSSGELTKAKEGLASALDLLHIENIIDEDTHKARKDDLKEYTDKIKAKKKPEAPKIKKKLLQRLDDPKTTKSKKKNILWHMRSGYFGPTQFKNKAKKIMGEAKSMDLLSKEVRASAKSQNSYFTTPETSGKVKK